ncbi:MAG: lipoyl(octanoyl) transferase [Candidatus Azotimanducaceae bacterium]
MTNPIPIIKYLGRSDYEKTWQAMKQFTDQRDANTADELWITEHDPVFTQGLNGKPEHILQTSNIPVIQIDRGGQITYHGPGQLVLYCLLNIQRLGFGVRTLVSMIEQSIVELLVRYDIDAFSRPDAPGVYVSLTPSGCYDMSTEQMAKIAALGLRIRKGCCYHGLSLNINMDLKPFSYINPCGFEGLAVTQMMEFNSSITVEKAGRELAAILSQNMRPKN